VEGVERSAQTGMSVLLRAKAIRGGLDLRAKIVAEVFIFQGWRGICRARLR
jgi:hypothetical protein